MDATENQVNAQHPEVERFMKKVEERNPNEPEFIQAVQEVAETIVPYLEDHPKYKELRVLERIAEPERLITFRVTWVDDSGQIQLNKGYRVQMNSAIGPYKGGLRFHPSVNTSVLKFLAFEQVFKNSLTTLPLGGGKGGSDFDPKGKSDGEIMRFCQNFMSELYRHIGPYTDVPAGDIGVGGREIGYLFGQYKKLRNEFTGVMTGKDIHYGGSLIRPEATGYGCVYFTEQMLESHGEMFREKDVVISGSGNVAQHACEKAIHLGAKVLTLSDSGGTVYDKGGIDQKKLEYIKELKNVKRGRIKEFAEEFGCEYLEGVGPWEVKCHVALPCATQNELTEEDARALVSNGVHAVAEGANMPCTPEAVHVLKENDVLFAPGKASNAGGVAVSGLEMTQNSMRYSWWSEEVDNKLKEIMKSIHEACVKHGTDSGTTDYVKGANIAGFEKVASAMSAQGVL